MRQMTLPLALFTHVVAACAPEVAPRTSAAIAATESRFDPLAIFDGTTHRAWRPRDRGEAIALARRLIGAGHAVDLGLMQVNSRNLPVLGLTVGEAFDPCANIRAGGAILTADYIAAARTRGEGQAALRAALSAYNTGSVVRGFRNGYVARVVAAARYVVPEIAVSPAPTGQPAGQARGLKADRWLKADRGLKAHTVPHRATPEKPASPGWQVFGAAAGAAAASSSWNVFPQSVGPGRLPGPSTPANPSNGGPQHE
jgi:type IV secretion system protein VirB1